MILAQLNRLRQEQSMVVGNPELFTSANAASDPNGNEANATTGWSSSTSSIDITVEPTDVNVGSYAILGTANQATTFARLGISFPVTNGDSYEIKWDGKEGAGADARLYLFTNVSGTAQSMTTSWASYTKTVTATTTGTATIQWVLVSSAIGHLIYLDNLSIKKV